MGKVDCHFVFRPLTGKTTECGDTGVIRMDGSNCFLALVDALGHGPVAYEIACLAEEYLAGHFRAPLLEMIQGLHEHLKRTKGAVAALCRLDMDTGCVDYVGTGNITVRTLGTSSFTFIPRDGIIGYLMPSPKQQRQQIFPGDVMVMYSDGLRPHFNSLDCSDLLKSDAATMAQGLLERFGKNDDDASCIVLRYLS